MADFNAQPLERLIANFQKLSGVGRKGATRMAYQILSMDKAEAEEKSEKGSLLEQAPLKEDAPREKKKKDKKED